MMGRLENLCKITESFVLERTYYSCLFNKSGFIGYALQDGINIVGVNYGSPGSCQYPRPLKVVSPNKSQVNGHF